MDKPLYKTVSFWIALVMTNISLVLATNAFGTGSTSQVLGWIMAIASALGYKVLTPATKEEAPPAA